MNWELVGWFAGVVATIYGLKFVLVLFKSLFGKQSMTRVIDGASNAAVHASDRMKENLRCKIEERRERKQQEKYENRPVVVDR